MRDFERPVILTTSDSRIARSFGGRMVSVVSGWIVGCVAFVAMCKSPIIAPSGIAWCCYRLLHVTPTVVKNALSIVKRANSHFCRPLLNAVANAEYVTLPLSHLTSPSFFNTFPYPCIA